MPTKLADALAYPPRGLRLERAAAYVGMSKTSFLTAVADNTMPKPVRWRGLVIWDRLELDAAFEDLKRPPDEPQSRRNTVDVILGIKKDDNR